MRQRFARAAADRDRYEQASWLQREVAKRMLERLEYMRLDPRIVVDAGAGSGHALAALGERFPAARLVAVDIVPEQLEPLAPGRTVIDRLRRWIGPPRTHPVVADYSRLPLRDASIGCVWSNLSLQWTAEPSQAFAEWHRVLETSGLVMFSTLGPDTLKELRAAWSGGDRSARLPPRVHPFIDMHDLGDMLVGAGFADPVMDMEALTLTYRDVDALLADLQGAGAAGAHVDRPRGLTGKASWRALRDAYETRRRDDGQLPATFEIVYGHAWKPTPRARADSDGVARVRVEDIGGLGRRR